MKRQLNLIFKEMPFVELLLKSVILVILMNSILVGESVENKIITAKFVSKNKVRLVTAMEYKNLPDKTIRFEPDLKVKNVEEHKNEIFVHTEPADFSKYYKITINGTFSNVEFEEALNDFYSEKPLGCNWTDSETFFRVFSPRATEIKLVLFDDYASDDGVEYNMSKDTDGVWETSLNGHYFGKYYGYKVDGPDGPGEDFHKENLIADPYSRAVASINEYQHRSKTLIYNTDDYNWEGDKWLDIEWQDLMIYECHMRDMTAHKSAKVDEKLAGTYKGFIDEKTIGGLNYLKELGMNAVEFLPIHDFGNIEPPYGIPAGGITNTWNPYARNHWGYMTSYFFAPESYYASEQTLEEGKYIGQDGRQVNEFKDVVKACHKNNIAVIMDVVYNHVSQYDQNCFKHLDKKYYFHLNDDKSYCSASGCGNDFKTDRPMARKLIVDSILFWMQEYHVDGFRFDLASMIDWDTVDEIYKKAREINPNVILIAEPWGGGGYSPDGFSKHNWAAWNDQFRNAIKGQNPENGHGFIFGKYWDFNNEKTLKRYIYGNLAKDGGLFQDKKHAINYLESHDDHTFGDFVRIGSSDKILGGQKLSKKQMRLNKLGAFFLFTSQGAVMIHEGQEYARSKIIAPTMVPDSHVGQIDHNSYNKDNETNWVNFDDVVQNKELCDYYRNLIHLRQMHPAFRNSPPKAITFLENKDAYTLGYHIDSSFSKDKSDFCVLINANSKHSTNFQLPSGHWAVLADGENVGVQVLREISGTVTVLPTTGMILGKLY